MDRPYRRLNAKSLIFTKVDLVLSGQLKKFRNHALETQKAYLNRIEGETNSSHPDKEARPGKTDLQSRPMQRSFDSALMDGDEEDSSPFTTRQFAAVIDGVHTEFFLSGYENRYFFVISQLGKLGTLV